MLATNASNSIRNHHNAQKLQQLKENLPSREKSSYRSKTEHFVAKFNYFIRHSHRANTAITENFELIDRLFGSTICILLQKRPQAGRLDIPCC